MNNVISTGEVQGNSCLGDCETTQQLRMWGVWACDADEEPMAMFRRKTAADAWAESQSMGGTCVILACFVTSTHHNCIVHGDKSPRHHQP